MMIIRIMFFLKIQDPSVQRRFTSPVVTDRLSHSACLSFIDKGVDAILIAEFQLIPLKICF